MMPQPHPETNENKKPQITQITQIFIFFLFVFSQLPSFRVSSCNFVANFLVIFMGVLHETVLSPENHEIKTFSVSSVSSVAKLISGEVL
jgi:hypothetical protein